MEECNQIGEQGFTACGVDQFLVVCSFDRASNSGCLHDSGPCQHGLASDGYVGECQGRSQYVMHLPSEKYTRRSHHYEQARSALSIAVAAMCEMTYQRNDETRRREEIFLKALEEIRGVAGEIRLTSMSVECAWCGKYMGQKEGNGATGLTSTICPDCFAKQTGADVPPEVRQIAEAIGAAIGDVQGDKVARVTGETPEEFRRTLGEALLSPEDRRELEAFRRGKGPERGNPAEVAASTGPYLG